MKAIVSLIDFIMIALWRDFKLTMGSSANQVKPVRILDATIKQKFFFGLLEPGQEVPDLYFLKKE